MPVGERRDLLTRHTSLNGKARNRKKQLRRRSSGGPETVCAQEAFGQDIWNRIRRDLTRRSENPDLLLDRRRGSLPIEMLTVGHSGKNFFFYIIANLPDLNFQLIIKAVYGWKLNGMSVL